jgi:hypothetical protein
MDNSEYLEIKERAWERLSRIPGVHAVGLGTKSSPVRERRNRSA